MIKLAADGWLKSTECLISVH